MAYGKNKGSQIKKPQQKHPVYEDKSETRRKVVIVRGTLMVCGVCHDI